MRERGLSESFVLIVALVEKDRVRLSDSGSGVLPEKLLIPLEDAESDCLSLSPDFDTNSVFGQNGFRTALNHQTNETINKIFSTSSCTFCTRVYGPEVPRNIALEPLLRGS